MLPIKDQIPTRSVPIVNYLLIAANILVFLFQYSMGDAVEQFVYQYALIPGQLTANWDLTSFRNVFTSMFMHAGLAHIGGNMLYLWIFGDNVEDAMGKGRYLLFYLIGGLTAAGLHVLFNPGSQIPTVGASGAIAAVLGAYLVLYPQSKVLTLLTLGYFIRLTLVPAVFVLGLWFLLQFFMGVLSLGSPDVGGVAFWAHIGGFAAGVVLARIFSPHRRADRLRYWEQKESPR